MKSVIFCSVLIAMVGSSIWAAPNDLQFPVSFGKLADRAKESVDVTLDSSMLHLASGFLSQQDHDEAQVKRLVSRLKGVYVRSFEFEREGEYSLSDVEFLRQQLKSPIWTRIVKVRSNKDENSDIFLKKDGDRILGLVVIAAEPKELTVVHIDGPINPQELSELSGHMGIPRITSDSTKKAKEEE